MVTPERDGEALTAAIVAAMRDARFPSGGPDYVATHGCATVLGDASEHAGLRAALGAGADTVASSVKPAVGHLVAAAGAVNVAVAALAVREDVVPPTLNLEDPDPRCAFDWVPGQARQIPVRRALALARGLHGQNVALALAGV
ncbi:hypothetical protein [Phytohabitans houttuyneae]|uniref:Ketosynthase family 3 (KS3) domain-containing protein n=2 Tax=Phytohabitans houttuyneae TaxID=1076126 RepID=A0A6V8KIX1_9ACTN|nr:hypothetical protein [Phytohabitans houttuyneae]GFJ83380.1 hypothetical protein Phou_075600 [Phytohabitans houttuyneae]